jgi:nucleoside-diphosphate-sugar epimerase
MNIKKAVVTGAAGAIGSYLVRKLHKLGVQVIAIDNLTNVPPGRVEYLFGSCDINLYKVDVLDRNAMNDIFKNIVNVDVYFDLAYINGTQQFYSKPLEILSYAGIHVQESFHWVKKLKARWVYFSTPEIYGEPIAIPTPENHQIVVPDISNPRFSYSVGKIFSESFIHASTRQTDDLDVVIVRPNNVYGATDRYHVISDLVGKVLNNQELKVQGSGQETRSFCYVEDAIDQILLVAKNGLNRETYNIGSEEEVTIKKLYELIICLTGYVGQVKFLPLTEGSPRRRCPDLTKLYTLGSSQARPLEMGLREMLSQEILFRNFINKNKKS